jgi:hypothetical protein
MCIQRRRTYHSCTASSVTRSSRAIYVLWPQANSPGHHQHMYVNEMPVARLQPTTTPPPTWTLSLGDTIQLIKLCNRSR